MVEKNVKKQRAKAQRVLWDKTVILESHVVLQEQNLKERGGKNDISFV